MKRVEYEVKFSWHGSISMVTRIYETPAALKRALKRLEKGGDDIKEIIHRTITERVIKRKGGR